MMNDSRKTANRIVRLRNFKKSFQINPPDYERDKQVLIYETAPEVARQRLEKLKADRAAGVENKFAAPVFF